jgi:hypothetical protein
MGAKAGPVGQGLGSPVKPPQRRAVGRVMKGEVLVVIIVFLGLCSMGSGRDQGVEEEESTLYAPPSHTDFGVGFGRNRAPGFVPLLSVQQFGWLFTYPRLATRI